MAPGVRWTKPSWGVDPPVLSSDYIQRLRSPPAGTAQLQLIVDVYERMTQFAGLDGVPMPKIVIADISKAITCMSRGSSWSVDACRGNVPNGFSPHYSPTKASVGKQRKLHAALLHP
eukprot:6143393-Amphidinium_carterae.1